MTATCRGVDVSAYQANQDWKALVKAGVAFAWIKASEGQHTHDPKFATHAKAARAAGVQIGGYHFGWPNQDVHAEAANYVAAVKAYAKAGTHFVHWLDVEAYSDHRNVRGVSAAHIRTWVTTWVQLVEKAYPGQRVDVYAGGPAHTAGWVPAGLGAWYPAYPWTSGSYAQAEAHARPSVAGRQVTMWQFTSKPLDRTLCYMSAAQLREWADTGPKKPAPVKKPTPPKKPAPAHAKPRVWTVKRGQTLSGIALALGVTVASLVSTNHIKNANVIYPGQHITAPAKAPAKKAATTCH